MEQLLGDTKRLVQRLGSHDNSVDILTSEAASLQNRLVAMRQYRDEVNKMNDIANHRPRSTLILGSQLENQRIQNLEQENRELTISLAEHQSALDLIMNKYREQVLLMMKPNSFKLDLNKGNDQTIEIVAMKERITEMARVMCKSAAIDDSVQFKEIEFIRKLQVENENLRELLEISGGKLPGDATQKIDYFNADIDCISPEESFMKHNSSFSSSLQSHLSADNNMVEQKITVNTTDSMEEFSSGDDDDFLASFPSGKLKRRYGGNKRSKILPLSFEEGEAESNTITSDISTASHIRNLEQLFLDPNSFPEKDSRSEHPLSPVLDSDSTGESGNYFAAIHPSENCFRAIITDIKPLDVNIDMNEQLFQRENISDPPADDTKDMKLEEESSYLSASLESPPFDDTSELSQEFSATSIDLPETYHKKDDHLSKSPNSDDITSCEDAMSESEVPDVVSDISCVHDSFTNSEIKDHIEDRLDIPSADVKELDVLDELDDVLDFEMDDCDDDDESDGDQNEMGDYCNDDESDGDQTVFDSTYIENTTSGEKTQIINPNVAVIDCYLEKHNISVENTVIDSSDQSIIDKENLEDISDQSIVNKENFEEYNTFCDDSNVPELACLESSSGYDTTLTVENITESNENSNEIVKCEDIQGDKKSIALGERKENDEVRLSRKACLQVNPNKYTGGCKASIDQIRTEDCNGEISDNDSEVTYTEEDINDALSDFDNYLDSNEDDYYDNDPKG